MVAKVDPAADLADPPVNLRLPPTELRPEADEFGVGSILRVLNGKEAESLITPE